jgi:hypothetical protein
MDGGIYPGTLDNRLYGLNDNWPDSLSLKRLPSTLNPFSSLAMTAIAFKKNTYFFIFP